MSTAVTEVRTLGKHEIAITRIFDAPRALVWKCFTEPEHMKQWWGPKGSTIIASYMDLRVGGSYHGAMRDPEGRVMWAKFVYHQIVAPELLVWEHSFSNEAGSVSRHPMSPTWPLKLLTTVTFEDIRAARQSSPCAGHRSTPARKSAKLSTRRAKVCAAVGVVHSTARKLPRPHAG